MKDPLPDVIAFAYFDKLVNAIESQPYSFVLFPNVERPIQVCGKCGYKTATREIKDCAICKTSRYVIFFRKIEEQEDGIAK